jgi:hypothetical protein
MGNNVERKESFVLKQTRFSVNNDNATAWKYSGTSVYVLNPFQILGLSQDVYQNKFFPIRNEGKIINPFP